MPREKKPIDPVEIKEERKRWREWKKTMSVEHPEYSLAEVLRRYCQKRVSEKIEINMREIKGQQRWSSPKQAIAVSYSQVRRGVKRCDKVLDPNRKVASRKRSVSVRRRSSMSK